MTRYYRRFIVGYGKIARSLSNLFTKGGFEWGFEAMEAFKQLKEAITTDPVLKLPNFSQPFSIECDASRRGIGVVLSQNLKLIAYFSKALAEATLFKSIHNKELMALVLDIHHWRLYLLGKNLLYTRIRGA